MKSHKKDCIKLKNVKLKNQVHKTYLKMYATLTKS